MAVVGGTDVYDRFCCIPPRCWSYGKGRLCRLANYDGRPGTATSAASGALAKTRETATHARLSPLLASSVIGCRTKRKAVNWQKQEISEIG